VVLDGYIIRVVIVHKYILEESKGSYHILKIVTVDDLSKVYPVMVTSDLDLALSVLNHLVDDRLGFDEKSLKGVQNAPSVSRT